MATGDRRCSPSPCEEWRRQRGQPHVDPGHLIGTTWGSSLSQGSRGPNPSTALRRGAPTRDQRPIEDVEAPTRTSAHLLVAPSRRCGLNNRCPPGRRSRLTHRGPRLVPEAEWHPSKAWRKPHKTIPGVTPRAAVCPNGRGMLSRRWVGVWLGRNFLADSPSEYTGGRRRLRARRTAPETVT
jgi:hypothetical protein